MTLVTEAPKVERATLEALARPGHAAVDWIDEAGEPYRTLTLWTYRPENWRADGPVVVSQHGMGRNAWNYRDFWIEPAKRFGALIVAIEFSDAAWPGPESYNNGCVLGPNGVARPRSSWGYHVPARVVAALRAAGVVTGDDIRLYGHSAGAQFAHRMLSLVGPGPFREITAANAGWWSAPRLDAPYPAGLGGVGLDDRDVARLLAYPLVLLAGDRDTETADPQLPSDPEAMAQGPHRFARARRQFEVGRAEAERRGVAFGWRLITVPGIGHDGDAMAKVVAELWFAGRMPDTAALAGGHAL